MISTALTRAVLGAAGVLAASAALAAPAHAALVQTTKDCTSAVASQPFAAWGDTNQYKLVDGGSFEDGAPGWKLGGGASVVAGNEPFRVHGATDSASLLVPAGSTVVSAPVCVGHDEPTLRYFGRSGNLLATVAVAAQVTLVGGLVVPVPLGIDGGTSWSPSGSLHIVANYLPPAGEYTAVRFTFTPLLGAWQFDDVYVDPRAKF